MKVLIYRLRELTDDDYIFENYVNATKDKYLLLDEVFDDILFHGTQLINRSELDEKQRKVILKVSSLISNACAQDFEMITIADRNIFNNPYWAEIREAALECLLILDHPKNVT